MTGIICAMKIEAEKIIEAMADKEERVISGIVFTKGRICGREAVVAVCGIGKVFAAICAEAMIIEYKPEIIINTGVAGGLADEIKIGDIAVSTNVVQHDMDTSPLGDPVGLLSGINIVEVPSDKEATEKMYNCAKKLGIRCIKGVIASGDQFVADKDKKQYIKDTFNAVACEMEGGSIGHVCYVNGVKFCIIRAISDSASDESKMDYPAFAKMAAERSAETVKLFLKM